MQAYGKQYRIGIRRIYPNIQNPITITITVCDGKFGISKCHTGPEQIQASKGEKRINCNICRNIYFEKFWRNKIPKFHRERIQQITQLLDENRNKRDQQPLFTVNRISLEKLAHIHKKWFRHSGKRSVSVRVSNSVQTESHSLSALYSFSQNR